MSLRTLPSICKVLRIKGGCFADILPNREDGKRIFSHGLVFCDLPSICKILLANCQTNHAQLHACVVSK